MTNDIPSPCIDVCKMNPATDLCQGCLRTRDEIKAWKGLNTAGKKAILAEIERRKALSAP